MRRLSGSRLLLPSAEERGAAPRCLPTRGVPLPRFCRAVFAVTSYGQFVQLSQLRVRPRRRQRDAASRGGMPSGALFSANKKTRNEFANTLLNRLAKTWMGEVEEAPA